MKIKRLFCSLLSLVIVISAVFAVDFSAFAAKKYSFNTINDTIVYTHSSDYDITINVFGQTTCYNTYCALEELSEMSFIKSAKIKINFIDLDSYPKEVVKDYANEIGCNGISYCYETEYYKAFSIADELRSEYTNEESYSLPFVAYSNSSGKVVNFTSGYTDESEIVGILNDYFGKQVIDNSKNTITFKGLKYCQTEARKMLSMINEFRASSDNWCWDYYDKNKVYPSQPLDSLTYDYQLEEAAMQRAAEIAYYYDHTRPNGELFYTAYAGGYYAAGENIAYGQTSAQEVFTDWREDNEGYDGQGHRRNMLDEDFTAVAFGCVYLNGIYYWVQEFRDPTSTKPATSALDSKKDVQIEVVGQGMHDYSDVSITKKPTCQSLGKKEFNCIYCDNSFTEDIPKTDHKATTVKGTAATLKKDGKTAGKVCADCGKTITAQKTIAKPSTFTLSSKSYTYDGKAKKPTLTVKDSNGKTISSSNYKVTYASGRKKPGKYKVTVKFSGNYSGTKELYFTINPKGTSLSSVSANSKGFTVKWKKQKTETSGYEIQYSTDSKFAKNNKIVDVKKNSTTSQKVKKLKAKKKYYVRIRTYKTVSGEKYYSSWSKSIVVKTKK